jgi:hypothetical protein
MATRRTFASTIDCKSREGPGRDVDLTIAGKLKSPIQTARVRVPNALRNNMAVEKRPMLPTTLYNVKLHQGIRSRPAMTPFNCLKPEYFAMVSGMNRILEGRQLNSRLFGCACTTMENRPPCLLTELRESGAQGRTGDLNQPGVRRVHFQNQEDRGRNRQRGDEQATHDGGVERSK